MLIYQICCTVRIALLQTFVIIWQQVADLNHVTQHFSCVEAEEYVLGHDLQIEPLVTVQGQANRQTVWTSSQSQRRDVTHKDRVGEKACTRMHCSTLNTTLPGGVTWGNCQRERVSLEALPTSSCTKRTQCSVPTGSRCMQTRFLCVKLAVLFVPSAFCLPHSMCSTLNTQRSLGQHSHSCRSACAICKMGWKMYPKWSLSWPDWQNAKTKSNYHWLEHMCHI